jgi:hypothetical protein
MTLGNQLKVWEILLTADRCPRSRLLWLQNRHFDEQSENRSMR